MKLFSNLFIPTTVGIAVLTLALIGTVTSQPAKAADQIIEIRNGSVTLQRDNKTQPAGVGTTLRAGDEIRPASGAVVTVLCDNNTTRQIRRASGLGSICPDSVAVRFNTRGRGGCNFLAFLNHRCIYATQILVADPTLHWSPIMGVNQYQVQINQTNQVIWQQTVTGTQIHHEGTPLQLGESYQLLVTAADNQDTQPIYRLSLERLDDAQTKAVQDAIAQINAQELSPEGKALALSSVYQEAGQASEGSSNNPGLVLDAIGVLEPLVSAGNQTPYVHRLLGDLYLQIGLLEMAATRYQEAVSLAQAAIDHQNQASAEVGLANIAAAKGDRTMAEYWLRQAKQSYEASGDSEQIDLVDQWLNKLNG